MLDAGCELWVVGWKRVPAYDVRGQGGQICDLQLAIDDLQFCSGQEISKRVTKR